MRKGGTTFQGSCLYTLRIHACKAVLLALIVFIFIEYATNLFVYKEPINKIVAPGLAWISSSFNHELNTNEESMSSAWDNNQPCVHNCQNVSVNRIVTSSSNASKSDLVKTLSNNSTSQKDVLKECPLVPPKLGESCMFILQFVIEN